MKYRLAALPLLALIAACSQSDAPSEQMGAAAEDLVEAVLDAPAAEGEVALPALAPRDDCAELEGGGSFTTALAAAIAMRDTDVLIALTAEDVQLGFGGVDGAKNLRANLDGPEPNLWTALEEVITMGCAANSQGGITMPYYFAQETGLDPFESMIVTGYDVPLRAMAGGDAQLLAEVSWEEVQSLRDENGVITFGANPDNPDQGWSKVLLPATPEREEAEGFIAARDLRSVIDYRLIAASRNGRWRITAFLAGD